MPPDRPSAVPDLGGVVEIQATFLGAYDVFGQSTGAQQALGTGFVVSRDGYILTNAHVVSENGQAVSTVTVIFKGDGSQGTQVKGTVLGADESTDVALIKVDPSQTPGLEPIPLGDSSTVTVGEEVVAIGNPLGLDFSLSSGVVSATDRELQSPSGATISGGIAAAGRTADRGPALARVSQDWYHYLSAWRPLSTAPALKGSRACAFARGERARRAASAIALATPMAEARHEEQESPRDRTL